MDIVDTAKNRVDDWELRFIFKAIRTEVQSQGHVCGGILYEDVDEEKATIKYSVRSGSNRALKNDIEIGFVKNDPNRYKFILNALTYKYTNFK